MMYKLGIVTLPIHCIFLLANKFGNLASALLVSLTVFLNVSMPPR